MAEPILAEIVDPQRPGPAGQPCPACGAPVDQDDSYCSACGTPRPPSVLSSGVVSAASDGRTGSPADGGLRQSFECKSCGSRVARDPNVRSYTCPFCDSNYVIEFADSDRRDPDFVIGFAVTPEQAQEKFTYWIRRNSWFRPGDLDRSVLEGKLVGVYLPFWYFSMLAESVWSAQIGEYWYRTETYTTTDSNGKTVTRTRTVQETEWWTLDGRHHRYQHSYLVSASRGLTPADAEQVKPFQLPGMSRYKPYYLAGWLSEEYAMEEQQALDICQDVFRRSVYDQVRQFLPGDTHRALQVSTDFSQINADLCLLPVYVWSYRYKEHVFRFLVNGQTGKTAGEKPVSRKRIGAAVAVMVLLIALVLIGGWLLELFH